MLPAVESMSQGHIIQISRKLRMHASDPIQEKEFYINLGRKHDVRAGDVLEVSRKVPVVDALSEGTVHLMRVFLGEIRIYFVGESISLGRLFRGRSPAELPPLEYLSFMLGDEVELKNPVSF